MVYLADGRKKTKPCYPSTADGREGKQTEMASFIA